MDDVQPEVTPAAETPAETPAAEAPTEEAPKVEAAQQESPKAEPPKAEPPKQEAKPEGQRPQGQKPQGQPRREDRPPRAEGRGGENRGGEKRESRGGERGGPRGDERRGDERRGGERGERREGRPGGGRPFEGPPEIELEKLISDSLYLDNQAHAVVARMRDMDSGTKSQLRRLYNAVRRAVRAPESERQHQFVLLRARLAYTIARHSLRSLDALERLLLQVTRKNDARGYERFKDLFEAIVAYNE
jgi:CRISPR type III-A-associated protein Csm2